jgi:hypothetical protein
MEAVYCMLGNKVVKHSLKGSMQEWRVPRLPVKAGLNEWRETLILSGGFVEGLMTRALHSWDEVAGLAVVMQLPYCLVGHASIIVGDCLYVFGGEEGRQTKTAAVIDLESGSMSPLPELPANSKFMGCTNIGNSIYLAGGPGQKVIQLDLGSRTYTNIADLEFVVKRPRLFPISSHFLLMFGGFKDTDLYCPVQVYDVADSSVLPIKNHFAIAPEIYTGTAVQRGHYLHIGTARGHRVVVNLKPLLWEIKLHYGDVYWRSRRALVFLMKYLDNAHEGIECPVYARLSRNLQREVVEFV